MEWTSSQRSEEHNPLDTLRALALTPRTLRDRDDHLSGEPEKAPNTDTRTEQN